MAYFEVSGKGAKTGKPWKARTFFAADEERARRMAEAAGMIADQVERLPEEPPSERQRWYAGELGINIPPGATMAEVSDLIDYCKENDEPADDETRAFAQRYGVIFTKYMGRKCLYQRIWNSHEVSSVPWFVFCLYKDLLPRHASQAATDPDHPAIKEIADRVLSEPSVVHSISRYRGEDLAFFGERTRQDGHIVQGGSNRTIAYKRVGELLRRKDELQMTVSREERLAGLSSGSSCFSPSVAGRSASGLATTPKGCLSTLLLMAGAASAILALACL